MNRYDLAVLLKVLRGRHEGPLVLRDYDQDGYAGAMLIGKRA
jgi:hypothetical protein